MKVGYIMGKNKLPTTAVSFVSTMVYMPILILRVLGISAMASFLIKFLNLYPEDIFLSILIATFFSGLSGAFIKRVLIAEVMASDSHQEGKKVPSSKVFLNILFTFLVMITLLKSFGIPNIISLVLGFFLLIAMLLAEVI